MLLLLDSAVGRLESRAIAAGVTWVRTGNESPVWSSYAAVCSICAIAARQWNCMKALRSLLLAGRQERNSVFPSKFCRSVLQQLAKRRKSAAEATEHRELRLTPTSRSVTLSQKVAVEDL